MAGQAATFFFCKSICLNTFRLKGKNVSAFQAGGLLGSGWLWGCKVWQCVDVCVCVCVCTHSLPCPTAMMSL